MFCNGLYITSTSDLWKPYILQLMQVLYVPKRTWNLSTEVQTNMKIYMIPCLCLSQCLGFHHFWLLRISWEIIGYTMM